MLRSLCHSTSRLIIVKCRSPLFTTTSKTRVRSSAGHTQTLSKVIPTKQPSLRTLVRCSLFAYITVSGVCVGSVILEYELWRSRAMRSRLDASTFRTSNFFYRVRKEFESVLGRSLKTTDVFWAIATLNILVFIGLRSYFSPFFTRYFFNSPYGATPALSMLLSVFSHHSFLHLAINMYVLQSFTPTLISMIGPGEYITLFVGGGVFASYVSLLSKLAHRIVIPSLGSSGGICAVLGAFCMLKPDSRLCIPFVVDVVPHSFPAYAACWTILGLEFAASMFLFRRSPIDHAAHLGGLLFGIYYSMAGVDDIWKRRSHIITKWTEWRGR